MADKVAAAHPAPIYVLGEIDTTDLPNGTPMVYPDGVTVYVIHPIAEASDWADLDNWA